MDPTDFLITLALSVGAASIGAAGLLRWHLRSQLGKLGLKREGDAYRGVVDGVPVEVAVGHPASPLTVIVRPFTAIEFIGPHGVRPFGPIVLTGDEEFDRALAACGDEAAVRGTLDGDTRSGIRQSGIVVRYGQLEGEFLSIEHAESIVRFAVSLHRRSHCAPEERPAQLEDIARRDPSIPVRLRGVTTLARLPGEIARIDALARDGSLDESVRLHAAISAHAGDVLASIAASTDDGDRLAAATDTLGSFGSTELARALDHVRQFLRVNPRESLVRVLGRYGTVDDVPLLSGMDVGALRSAIRDAVRAIQGRIVGADDGALALAELQGGELAEAKDGGLSVTRTAKGDPPS